MVWEYVLVGGMQMTLEGLIVLCVLQHIHKCRLIILYWRQDNGKFDPRFFSNVYVELTIEM